MEEVFLSLGLDIIGLGVFNYDFKSITKESPVIKVWMSVGHVTPMYCETPLHFTHVRYVRLDYGQLARLKSVCRPCMAY